MKPEAKKIWASPQGGSLMEAMLQGRSLTVVERVTLKRLKAIDPPNKPEQATATAVGEPVARRKRKVAKKAAQSPDAPEQVPAVKATAGPAAPTEAPVAKDKPKPGKSKFSKKAKPDVQRKSGIPAGLPAEETTDSKPLPDDSTRLDSVSAQAASLLVSKKYGRRHCLTMLVMPLVPSEPQPETE